MNKKEVILILKLLSERLFFSVHIRLATGGFGCVPTAAGRAVYATCLGDGEQTRWNRSDFIGILREEHLPDWARESLKQIRQKDPAESPDMTTPTM